ncbi:hypothetical protein [Nonomuraea insulae]|uniref:Conjugal transfer protein TrbI n=1 Tax=Nonomuraea insulae TaxID=1616787 RepID=A0ABW1CBI7_9ACTN
MADLAQDVTTDRDDRMARFAAGARRVIVRAAAIGALVATGWLLAVLFGAFNAAPAAAETTAATGVAADSAVETGVADTNVATNAESGPDRSSDNTEAMAGRTVNGLNSQEDPGLPPPSSAGKILDTNGLVPNGGGSGPFGAATGDVARSVFDPRLQAGRAPLARLLPPVVRTAADDPSFSPD